ncbi:MAG: hypothetical protein JNL61_16855 [Rhizobiaceae bacterium]|nr:hypothetical protein [Rhizobiaceae bacterium]
MTTKRAQGGANALSVKTLRPAVKIFVGTSSLRQTFFSPDEERQMFAEIQRFEAAARMSMAGSLETEPAPGKVSFGVTVLTRLALGAAIVMAVLALFA